MGFRSEVQDTGVAQAKLSPNSLCLDGEDQLSRPMLSRSEATSTLDDGSPSGNGLASSRWTNHGRYYRSADGRTPISFSSRGGRAKMNTCGYFLCLPMCPVVLVLLAGCCLDVTGPTNGETAPTDCIMAVSPPPDAGPMLVFSPNPFGGAGPQSSATQDVLHQADRGSSLGCRRRIAGGQ
jgi:hypothetical protein